MKIYYLALLSTLLPFLIACQSPAESPTIEGQVWEKLTLAFEGPSLDEAQPENPFLHYRLMVHFQLGEKSYAIPGFFAADGNAAETSASAGSVWQVRFRPDAPGDWTYTASFRKGENIAVSDDSEAGEAWAFDGQSGIIRVKAAAEHPGRIIRTEGRYLHYAASGKPFLKGGADSPENFLAYEGFDGTFRGELPQDREGEATAKESLHRYEPHLQDWHEGDPSWQGGKGKSIIGALNYLADKGMNSVYFLTMNIGGDGKDVWPYTSYEERYRFDCSKLDQWEMVFDHMDRLGLMLHIVTQETENEMLLDSGDTGLQRKLFYRELIARFSHHLAVTWNMGEENGPADFTPNGQSTAQQKAMVEYVKTHDPYPNMVVIHTHSNPKFRDQMFEHLLGDPYLDGMSVQVGNRRTAHSVTDDWLKRSTQAGRTWIVCLDEIGHHSRGVDPDDRPDNNQDSVRAEVLWGNLMAGGGGVEWYFGYKNAHNDLGCEDWRSRDRLWDYTRHALDFFQTFLPFDEMESQPELARGAENFCFAKAGEVYVVYLLFGGTVRLDLSGQSGTFEVQWYNPRAGGDLARGTVASVSGGGVVDLGMPPTDPGQDWAILVKK